MVSPGGVKRVAVKKGLIKDISGMELTRLCNYGHFQGEGEGFSP